MRIREDGITILLIEHDVKLVMGLCDTVAVLDYRIKIAEGKPSEFSRIRSFEHILGEMYHEFA